MYKKEQFEKKPIKVPTNLFSLLDDDNEDLEQSITKS